MTATSEPAGGEFLSNERRGQEQRAEEDHSFRVSLLVGAIVVRDYRFDKDTVKLGRDLALEIFLDNPLVSRHHADLRRRGDLYALVDLESENGCYVNGRRVNRIALLNSGDEIQVAKFVLRFEAPLTTAFDAVADPAARPEEATVGGATMSMEPRMTKRLVADRARVKGNVLLPRRSGGTMPVFVSEIFQIGKAPECEFQLTGARAPRKAAVIVRGFAEYRICNVSSSPLDVIVNGLPVSNVATLKHEARIEVGGQILTFSVEEDGVKAPQASPP